MKKIAIIVAGGTGTRMGTSIPKQFLLLKNKPVLLHTMDRFLAAYEDLQLVLVLPLEHLNKGAELAAASKDPGRVVVVPGGRTRFHSVAEGLQQVQEDSIVFVHDGVRCLVEISIIHRCYETALEKGNAIPAIEAVDSLRLVQGEHNEALDRSRVRLIQTPQTFKSAVLKAAFAQEFDPLFTDEASVAERMGVKIHLVEGSSNNLKITKPLDLVIAEKLLEE